MLSSYEKRIKKDLRKARTILVGTNAAAACDDVILEG